MQPPTWTQDIFKAIDDMDTEKFLSYLTDNAVFRFGNMPAAEGKEAIKEAVNGFFQTIKGLRHSVQNVWAMGETTIVQGSVTYTKNDDFKVTLPFCNIFNMQADKVKEYLVYVDVSPLFAE